VSNPRPRATIMGLAYTFLIFTERTKTLLPIVRDAATDHLQWPSFTNTACSSQADWTLGSPSRSSYE
jgi:hypothetical protein